MILFADDEPINPLAHARDPETSHRAADEHRRNGKRTTNAQHVLRLLRTNPGTTARELHRMQWLDEACPKRLTLTEVRRRLTDLYHADMVRRGDAVGNEVTWWAA